MKTEDKIAAAKHAVDTLTAASGLYALAQGVQPPPVPPELAVLAEATQAKEQAALVECGDLVAAAADKIVQAMLAPELPTPAAAP